LEFWSRGPLGFSQFDRLRPSSEERAERFADGFSGVLGGVDGGLGGVFGCLAGRTNRALDPVQHSRTTTSTGIVNERKRQPGQVFWGDANVHMTENLSDIAIETLMVEIK
jgi:hypothetical protein